MLELLMDTDETVVLDGECSIDGCGSRATQVCDVEPLVIELDLVPDVTLCSQHAFEHLAAVSHSAVESTGRR